MHHKFNIFNNKSISPPYKNIKTINNSEKESNQLICVKI